MRSESSLHRWVLAATVFTLTACASNEPQPSPPPQNRVPPRPPMKQEGRRPPPNADKPKPPPPTPRMEPETAMQRIDTDHDGVITFRENMDFVLREADERFARMDRDHDGRLTKAEFDDAEKHRQSMKPNDAPHPNGQGGKPPPPGAQVLQSRADTNHDGVVDLAENRALAQQQAEMRFKAGDKNGDGSLERGEMEARPPRPQPAQ